MNIVYKFVFLCSFLFCNTAFSQGVAITQNEAKIWANQKGNELIQTLGMKDIIEKHSKLDKMMTEDVNLDYISKFVIGKYARKMNENQKSKYSQLFQRYVLSIYKQFNIQFNEDDIDFTIDKITEHPNYTTVFCSINASKIVKDVEVEKIPVAFKLIRGNKNKIQAVDIEISNVSMVIEYRKKFYKMIIDEGEEIDWFLEKFEDKIIANEEAVERIMNIQQINRP